MGERVGRRVGWRAGGRVGGRVWGGVLVGVWVSVWVGVRVGVCVGVWVGVSQKPSTPYFGITTLKDTVIPSGSDSNLGVHLCPLLWWRGVQGLAGWLAGGEHHRTWG